MNNLLRYKFSLSDYKNNIKYKKRVLINKEKPKFKLKAYCINLNFRPKNMIFIKNEWKNYLEIERFNALSSATKSHFQLFRNIWQKKENLNFPIVIMEDDVYRKNNFNKYWNKLLEIKNCDYIAFDAFCLEIRKNQNGCHKDFVSLKKHHAFGFNVYYKKFFDRFSTLEELNSFIKSFSPNIYQIDQTFTKCNKLINYTPKQQVCCQIVNKMSTTALRKTNNYLKCYKTAIKTLKNI